MSVEGTSQQTADQRKAEADKLGAYAARAVRHKKAAAGLRLKQKEKLANDHEQRRVAQLANLAAQVVEQGDAAARAKAARTAR